METILHFHAAGKACDLTPIGMEGTVSGVHYAVTRHCLLRNDKPYVLRMGEMQYSRFPSCDWERELIKMKEGGIDTVASYVFWNHHEKDEGRFDFSGRRDIRRFVDTCEKVGLNFFLRIGPWAHGEARYGGFPDWLIQKNCALRSNDTAYLPYVHRFYTAVYEQLQGSDNLLGIQVENELAHNPSHLATLLAMLKEIGFRAPLWTATAWGQAELPDGLLPVFGYYPEAPWEQHVDPLPPSNNFFFSAEHEDGLIGNDLLGDTHGKAVKNYAGHYPSLTCEQGGGMQNTYHRRPIVSAQDIAALALCSLGSGANGLGYYLYHGGVNPVERDEAGALVTYQESRESGYPNDCPIVSYDFQAPLGDCGQIRDSYYALKTLHRCIEAVGESLATSLAAFPDVMPTGSDDVLTPRVAVRSNGASGFVFYNNHVRERRLPPKPVTLLLTLNDETLTIPFTLPEDGCGLFPFRFPLGSVTVPWVKAIPVERTESCVVFEPLGGVRPELCLPNGTVVTLRDRQTIGGVEVVLAKAEKPTSPPCTTIPCTKVESVLSFEAFEHLRRLDGTRLSDYTVEYAVEIPADVNTICVQAMGNVAAAYAMDAPIPRLLSDYYCNGGEWYIDVRGVRRLRLKIQPLTPTDRGTVYFEYAVPEGVVAPNILAV